MASPLLATVGGFDAAESCSKCQIGQYGSDGANDDISCTKCPDGKTSESGSGDSSSCKVSSASCPTTKVINSDKAAANSITGVEGTSVTVTCNTGWSGTKATVCGSELKWSPIVECTAKSCTATQVSNSNTSDANSITGM